MQLKFTFRKATELGIALIAITTLVLAGCGGGGSSSNGGGVVTTSATVTPFKGPFSNGTVVIKDANGTPVSLVSGGTINASGVAVISYNASVAYPIIVEVTGSYYNEVTGTTETSTVPLRGIITSSSSISANSGVPVTIVTETAVADLQNRLGTFSSSTPITAASAVAALSTAGTILGIPASTAPVFTSSTHLTSDAGTLRLAALAVVANNQAGATLVDKAKALAVSLVQLGANAPTTIISQATYDNALTSVTSGALNMMAAGATAPTSVVISTTNYIAINSSNTPTQVAMVWGQSNAFWDAVDWQ